jgi:hypothetical protein
VTVFWIVTRYGNDASEELAASFFTLNVNGLAKFSIRRRAQQVISYVVYFKIISL